MKRIVSILIITFLYSATQAQTTFERTYGGFNFEEGKSVKLISDGNYIIGGWTVSYGSGSEDVYLLKINADGDTLWTQTYGEAMHDYGYDVQETADSGFVITGYTEKTDSTGYDVYLIRTDQNGDTLWT